MVKKLTASEIREGIEKGYRGVYTLAGGPSTIVAPGEEWTQEDVGSKPIMTWACDEYVFDTLSELVNALEEWETVEMADNISSLKS